MPALIVARTENLLGNADLDRLGRHLERCATCRATDAAFRRAERAYVATTHAPLDETASALFLRALADAAPVEGVEAIEEVVEPEPQPEPEVVGPQVVEPAPLVVEEHVAEPAPELEDDHTDDEGWTGEEEAVADDAYDHHMIEPGPATWNATEEPPKRRRRLRIILPAVVLAAGAAAGLAIAGVFDSNGGTSTVDTRTVQSTSSPPPSSGTTP